VNADVIERVAQEAVAAHPLPDQLDELHPFTRRLVDADAAENGTTAEVALADAVARERESAHLDAAAEAIARSVRLSVR